MLITGGVGTDSRYRLEYIDVNHFKRRRQYKGLFIWKAQGMPQ